MWFGQSTCLTHQHCSVYPDTLELTNDEITWWGQVDYTQYELGTEKPQDWLNCLYSEINQLLGADHLH